MSRGQALLVGLSENETDVINASIKAQMDVDIWGRSENEQFARLAKAIPPTRGNINAIDSVVRNFSETPQFAEQIRLLKKLRNSPSYQLTM